MGHKFAELAFTESVREVQKALGSRAGYASMEAGEEYNHVLGEHEATFHLKRPQPAFVSLLAAGWSPVYPCHVPPRDMRTKPIGTGPFKFVEFKQNEVIRLARNPDRLQAVDRLVGPQREREVIVREHQAGQRMDQEQRAACPLGLERNHMRRQWPGAASGRRAEGVS